MYKRERVTSLLVMLLIIALSIQNAYGSTNFKDIKSSDWYYENVQTLVSDTRTIIKGYPDGSFKPLNKLTKDQFITMCVRVAGFNLENGATYWAQNNIDKAYELEFIYPGEFIDFKEDITREEMSQIIVRVIKNLYGKQDYANLAEINNIVKDSHLFNNVYEESIQLTYKLGIITGYPDYTFKPKSVLTRSEATAVLVRVIDPSKRISYDYDTLYAKLYGDIDSHLLSGANWIDPLTATDYESASEDWLIMKSDMDYFPNQLSFDLDMVSLESTDDVSGAVEYDENGPLPGHLEDFERLLLRRMQQSDVDKILNYLSKKINTNSYLEHKEAFFFLDNKRYLVRLHEVILMEGTPKQAAVTVNFNIWYRDSYFIENYEDNILLIFDYDDISIYR